MRTHFGKLVEFAGSNGRSRRFKSPFLTSPSWHSEQCFSTKTRASRGSPVAPRGAVNRTASEKKINRPMKRRMRIGFCHSTARETESQISHQGIKAQRRRGFRQDFRINRISSAQPRFAAFRMRWPQGGRFCRKATWSWRDLILAGGIVTVEALIAQVEELSAPAPSVVKLLG